MSDDRRRRARRGARAPLALLAVSCLALSPASAQSPAPDDTTDAAAEARARAARRGAAVAVIDVTRVDLATVRTLSDLLASRVPGVTVRRTSGAAGAGSGVWMRGPAGIDGTDVAGANQAFLRQRREPLLVVDGVRADGTQESLTLSGQSAAPSRLDDFRLEDVATVEVLRGPAAAALYGVGADRGVIAITTRRGTRGGPRAGVHARTAAVSNAVTYAPLYGRMDTSTGLPGCTLDAAAAQLCAPGALVRRDALPGGAPFDTGVETDVGGFLQGIAGRRLGFYAGGGVERRPGTLDANDARRADARLRLDARPFEALEVSATGGYVHGTSRLPYSGGVYSNPLFRQLTLDASGTPPTAIPGGIGSGITPVVPDDAVRQELRRTTAGVSLTWRPAPALAWRAAYGGDDARTEEESPRLVVIGPLDPGVDGEARVRHSTLGASVAGSYDLARSLGATTTLGVERTAREANDSLGFGLVSARTRRTRYALVGVYAVQQLAWGERLALDLGARHDQETWSHTRIGLQPSASLSWMLPGREGGASRLWADRARLRAAYGDIHQPAPGRVDGPLGAGYGDYIPGTGSNRPERERTREVELGADATYLGGMLDVVVTGYDKATQHSVVPVRTYTTGGFPAFADALDVDNRGVELQLAARLLRSERLRWDAGLTFAANRNRVTGLRTAPIWMGYSPLFGTLQPVRPGAQLGAFTARRILGFADRNGDGMITSGGCGSRNLPDYSLSGCEILVNGAARDWGAPYPTREGSLSSSLQIGRRVTVSGLLDYRGGIHLYDATSHVRCAYYGNCRESNDPSAPLADQARVAAARLYLPSYMEDAGYVKLRELGVTVRLPERWVGPAGALGVTAAVRNLATWTRYTGGDPELAATASPFSGSDYFAQPQPRTFVLRAEVTR